MKRKILIIAISYILGILIGIYINISVICIYLPIIYIYIIYKIKKYHKIKIQNSKSYINSNKLHRKNFKMFSFKRYIRYVRLIFNKQVLLLFMIVTIISNTTVIMQNKKYNNIYNQNSKIEITGIIQSQKKETEFMNRYKIKVKKIENKSYKNIFFYIYIPKTIKENLEIGNIVKINGEYQKPQERRNSGGFDYSKYLKTLKIYGSINVEKVQKIQIGNTKTNENSLLKFFNNVKNKIQIKIYNIFPKDIANIFLGMILGNTEDIEEKTLENFRICNISHVLAVSGMHLSYLIIGVEKLLKNIVGKRNSKLVTIFLIFFYINITGATPSIMRAGIMGILTIFAFLFNRKSDIYTSLGISILINLIDNPYSIGDIGLQLSYGGTIGIILFQNNILELMKKERRKSKFLIISKYLKSYPIVVYTVNKLKEILSVTISAQIILLPLCIFHFNILGIYFLVTNVFVSIIIVPIVFLGFCLIFSLMFNSAISKCSATILSFLITVLIRFIEMIKNLPFSKIYITTPNIIIIVIFYFIVIIIRNIVYCYYSKNLNNTQRRLKNIIACIKYKYNQEIKRKIELKKYAVYLIIFIIISFFIMPRNLQINFIDVGQGDATLIITPKNKEILIDGGGVLNKENEVGKKTLLPYLLDKGITNIDLIVITHFDSDHCQGLFTIMKELKVKNIIIGKQVEGCENYEKFQKIVKEKKIKVQIVEEGQRIYIEKELYFDVLWPSSSNVISENSINNNSLVCKMVYQNFSVLFTGDIEEVAEKAIINKYKNVNILQSTILKVPHHGSKSSSIMEFLKEVKPKIALIGVGEKNTFGHPNAGVLERLERIWK